MRRRWPSVLKVGSTRFGPRKLIDLLSEAVEAEVHHSGDTTLVIIHGRYAYTVRERTAVPEDAIAVIADEVVARELEYLINDSATAVERPLVIRPLTEEQASTDGLSYDTKLRKYRTAGDTQGATDSVATKTADRVTSSINERLLDEANVEVWAGQILTPTLIETVSAQENVLINQAQVIKLVFDELAETNDSSSHNVASLVTSSVSEVGVVDGGVSATFSEAESYDISEVQASEDIPVGYVPQGGETLVIRAFANSVYASDRLLYQKGALSTLAEEQASVDSISVSTEPVVQHVVWHVDDGNDTIYELSPNDFSVVRSTPSPYAYPQGIGGNKDVIWFASGLAYLCEISPQDLSLTRSNHLSSSYIGMSGAGGDDNTFWASNWNNGNVYEVSTQDLSILRSKSLTSYLGGAGGDYSTVWTVKGQRSSTIYELSPDDFSIIRNASAPTSTPRGIGGSPEIIWYSDNSGRLYQLSPSDFSIVKSGGAPGSDTQGIGGK